MRIDKDISQRMNMLRFLMIFGVVVLHTPPYLAPGASPESFFQYFQSFFQAGVFRTTVPILTFISAYLIFSSGLDRQPAKLYEKKFYSLVVPFIVFNLGLLALVYVSQRYLDLHIMRDLLQADTKRWINAAFGITETPINYPLHFLRNLVVLVLAAPLLGMLLRRAPFLGFILVFCIGHFNLEGWLLERNNMLIVFYMGGMAALLQFDMRALDKYRVPALIVFCLLCLAIVVLRVKNFDYLVYVSPFLVWPAASLLTKTALGIWMARMSSYSFFIFLAHSPLLTAAWSVYHPYRTVIPGAVFWLVTPVAVVALLVLLWKILDATLGPAFAFATGCHKKKRVAQPSGNAAGEIVPATLK